jgi:hypothetical protein
MQKSFATKCREASEWIKNGGLVLPDDYSQVEKKSHAWLATINAKGWMTNDSQDGQEDERAYVCGFLKTKKAFEMVERINNTSDKICIVIQPMEKLMKSYIPLTRHRGKSVTRQHIYLDDVAVVNSMKEELAIMHVKNVSYVVAIDPTWNRHAYGPNGLWIDVVRALSYTTVVSGA